MWELLKNLFYKPQKGMGAVLDPIDVRDIPVSAFSEPKDIPSQHITDISFLDVNDQRVTGSCVGQAMAKMVEYYEYTKHNRKTDVSARFVYGMSKLTDGLDGAGTYPRNAAKMVKKYGAATTDTLDDDARGMNDEEYRDIGLTGDMLVDAQPRKIEGFARITDITPENLRQAIHENGVIAITFRVGDWSGEYVQPRQKSGYLGSGFHYTMLYGYLEDDVFLGLNSWGKSWGNNGKFKFKFRDYAEHLYDAIVFTEIPEDLLEKAKNQKYIFVTNMRIGMRSNEIKELQKRLGIEPVDGIFGPITKRVVIAYQIAHGLTGDGIVGPKTRAMINGEEDPLINAIIEVESNGHLYAIGDKHLEDKAYGPMQIRQPAVDDVNKANNTNYTSRDMLGNRELSIWIFKEYMKLYAPNGSDEEKARTWNGGPGWSQNPHLTDGYWEKVKFILGR